MVASSCSLSHLELKEQLGRYRTAGEGSELIEWDRRRLVIRVADPVPVSLIEVEQACCPFFDLAWDPASRCLAISVSASDHEAALGAISYALGVTEPASDYSGAIP